MIRIVLILIALGLAGWDVVSAAPWELPPGVKTLTVNGYPMAFLDHGSGPAIVFVHGGGSDYRSWTEQMASPLPNFRQIAVSLRNYYPERWNGKGDKFSTPQHADDLAKFIDGLASSPVYLVAHSRGGIVATLTARSRPDLVKKLVLLEPGFYSLAPESVPAQERRAVAVALRAAAARFEKGDMDGGLEIWADRHVPGSWKRLSEDDRQRSRDNAWTLIRDIGASAPVTCNVVGGLTMPLLLMRGEKSPEIYAQIIGATRQCRPSADLVVIPDAAHAMHRMNPKAFESALTDFLSR